MIRMAMPRTYFAAALLISGSLALRAADDDPRVIFYRFAKHSMSARKVTIYCDAREVTRLENRSYFTFQAPPGVHTFLDKKDSKRGVEPLTLNLEPGGQYFIEVEWVLESPFKTPVPHLTLTDPNTIGPFFRELKPMNGPFRVDASLTGNVADRDWHDGALLDISHSITVLPGPSTPDEEWSYTVRGDQLTLVGTERTHRISGFRHIGIAIGDEIKYSFRNGDSFMLIQDSTGAVRQLQFVKAIRNGERP